MRTLHIALLTLPLLAVSGCGMFGGTEDYKSGAQKSRPLEMPPDLVSPATDEHYSIPEGGAASYSEYAKSSAAQACTCPPANGAQAKPQVAAVAAPAAPVAPRLQDMPDGSKVIVIAQPFDRCWQTVGESLDRARIAVEDKDRSAGILYLKGGHNQITVKAAQANGASCTVAANDGSGAVNDETKKVIDSLYQALGK